jgi:hypothetical protein
LVVDISKKIETLIAVLRWPTAFVIQCLHYGIA